VISSSGRSSASQCAYTQLCKLFKNSKEDFNYEEAIRKLENTESALREKAVSYMKFLNLLIDFKESKS